MRGLQRGDHGLPTAAGQVHVEQDDVGEARGDPGDGRLDVLRLAYHVDAVPELGPDPGPEQGVIVNDEDPRLTCVWSTHFWLGSRFPAARGMVSDTSVPSPCVLRMAAEPPWRAIRARTESASPFRSPGTVSGSNPLPRSRTYSDTSVGSTSANSETTLAPDHFAALTVASPAAASSASRLSSRSQSPTVTASTGTPYLDSTSSWIFRTPAATVSSASASSSDRPSNSQERSSRSCI